MQIEDIKLYERNAKKHPMHQLKQIAESIEKLGFDQAVVCEKNGTIIIGHGRFLAARDVLKWQTIKVGEAVAKKGECFIPILIRDDLSPNEIKVRRLNDNKLNESEWDEELVIEELKELKLEGFDISLTGFDLEELEPTKGTEDDFDATLPEEPKSKLGDIYQLGEHRLMCGDATKREDVERLMDGEKADMVFTDPPYGVSVVGSTGKIGGSVLAKSQVYSPFLGDDEDYDPRFLLELAPKIFIWGANYFSDKLPRGQWIVWDKGRSEGTTFSDCELAWTNGGETKIKAYRCLWNGMIREGESEKRVHPTQKPIKLCAQILSDFDQRVILDLFGGSGSTLIACEQTGRKCRMMEISDLYVDVIISRWCKYTGIYDIIKNGEPYRWESKATDVS